MPGYKGHLTGGLVAYGVTLYALQSTALVYPTPLATCEWLGFALAGSLFPDIDTKSKGQKYFYGVLLAIFIALLCSNRIELLAVLAVVALLPLLVNHRGIFHRAWFVMLVPLVLALICGMRSGLGCHVFLFDAFFFIVGALSHLLLDLGIRRMFRV
jgi:hypothetical protein